MVRANSSSPTSAVSDSADYVVVSSPDVDSASSADESESEQPIQSDTESRSSQWADYHPLKLPENPIDASDDHLGNMENVAKTTAKENLLSSLIRFEEMFEKQRESRWVLNLETRLLNSKQVKDSSSIAAIIKSDLEENFLCQQLGFSVDQLPEHTYELFSELYKMDLASLKNPKRKVPWTPFPIRSSYQSMEDYISSAKRWIRAFFWPGDISPRAIQFVVDRLLQGLVNFVDLRSAMEGALVNEGPGFQTQSDVFNWFREFSRVESAVTTQALSGTAQVPVSTTQVPVGTSQAPVGTTQAHSGTTNAPPLKQPSIKCKDSLLPLVIDDSDRWAVEPSDISCYMSSGHAAHWKWAMDHHISLLNDLQVWTEVEQVPKKAKVLRAEWIFKYRDCMNSRQFNAEIQIEGGEKISSKEKRRREAQRVSHDVVRLMLALAVQHDWCIEHLEVEGAMSHGAVNQNVYVRLPSNVPRRTRVVRLNKMLPKLKGDQTIWENYFCDVVKKADFQEIQDTPGLFFNMKSNVRTIMLLDGCDILIFSGKQKRLDCMKSRLSKSLCLIEHGFPNLYREFRITKLNDGSITVDSSRKISDTLNMCEDIFPDACSFTKHVPVLASEMKRAVHIENLELGKGWQNRREKKEAESLDHRSLERYKLLVWYYLDAFMESSRPDIAYVTTYLKAVSRKPNNLHWRMLQRLLNYLDCHHNATIRYTKQARAELVCYAQGLSSRVDISDTHCGVVWAYGDPSSQNNNKIFWDSWPLNYKTDPHNALLDATKQALVNIAYFDDLLMRIHEKQPGHGVTLYADLDMCPKLAKNRYVKRALEERGIQLLNMDPDSNPASQLCSAWNNDKLDIDSSIVEYHSQRI